MSIIICPTFDIHLKLKSLAKARINHSAMEFFKNPNVTSGHIPASRDIHGPRIVYYRNPGIQKSKYNNNNNTDDRFSAFYVMRSKGHLLTVAADYKDKEMSGTTQTIPLEDYKLYVWDSSLPFKISQNNRFLVILRTNNSSSIDEIKLKFLGSIVYLNYCNDY